MKEFVIHATRSYFVTAEDEDKALDLFYEGAYHDKSDEDVEVQIWNDGDPHQIG